MLQPSRVRACPSLPEAHVYRDRTQRPRVCERTVLLLRAACGLWPRGLRTPAGRRMRHALLASFVLLCIGRPRPVAASELIVEWNAPPSCPSQAEILSRVEQVLGKAMIANLTASAEVRHSAGTFFAQLRITSGEGFGERLLESKRCDILADSVALVIALSAARSARAQGEVVPERDNGPLLALSAHVTLATGLLPGPALGAGGALAVEGLSALRFELGGSYYAARSETLAQTAVGGTFQLLRFGARGCRGWTLGAVELATCVGVQFYRIHGVGFGGEVTRSGAAIIWGPELGVVGRIRLWQHLALYIAACGVAPVSRQRFVFSDAGALHRTAAAAFQLFIAPEVRF